ncbi:family 16 glycoside hydrolase [Sunxiuqinia rutila]|uniref:DUF1080 domain-containing protein n=1 Tax=Sunxiuqinia rutila TaxID=1397841 RepID=UPI003D35FC36
MKNSLRAVWAFTVLLCTVSCQMKSQDEWISLFNGKKLDGWEAMEHPESFRVEDGAIVCQGKRAHLFYTGGEDHGIYKNFELKARVMTKPGANSGIFIHSKKQEKGWPLKGYEVQVNNSYQGAGDFVELKKTGSLYGIRNVYYPMVQDDEWFDMTVKVVENQVQVFINGIQVVDYIQPEKPYRPYNDQYKVLDRGCFALQAHDPNSTVYFKDIQLKVLPEGEKQVPPADLAWDTKITKLHLANFPVIDFHVHLKGGLTIEQAAQNSMKLGINYGIAPNCGLKFPVTDDESLYAYMDTVSGKPIFRGMQAEGREWVTLFSPEAIARFDYVFTDAMTWTDDKGRRMRLWMPEEVFVDDEQDFMEQLLTRIEAVVSQEPIDIHVNPTYLPEVLADKYDELWTDKRIDRFVNVLVERGVALEINSRLNLPSEKILRRAQEAGVKFTMGTNNITPDFGRLDYSLEMVEKLGLTYKDMFMPKPAGQKPVQLKGLPAEITG